MVQNEELRVCPINNVLSTGTTGSQLAVLYQKLEGLQQSDSSYLIYVVQTGCSMYFVGKKGPIKVIFVLFQKVLELKVNEGSCLPPEVLNELQSTDQAKICIHSDSEYGLDLDIVNKLQRALVSGEFCHVHSPFHGKFVNTFTTTAVFSLEAEFWFITCCSIIFGDEAFTLPFAPSYLKALTHKVFFSLPHEPTNAQEFITFFSNFISALIGLNLPQVFQEFQVNVKFCDLTSQLQHLLHSDPRAAIEGVPGDIASHCLPADTSSQRTSKKCNIIFGKGWPTASDRFSFGSSSIT
jgi:hypothetical protein